jgi:hypothetical protein
VTAIEEMAKGRTDAIALTSSDQVRVKPIDTRAQLCEWLVRILTAWSARRFRKSSLI